MNYEEIINNLPQLEADRLVLRKISINDAEDVFEIGSCQDVAQYVTWEAHKSIDDAKAFIKSADKFPEKKQLYPWVIVLKSENKVIGGCSFMNWQPEQSRAETGYMLSKKYWNKGYMTEALREVIKFGFEKMELNRIEALCNPENTASIKVLEKVGMKLEGLLRQYLFFKGKFWDFNIYSILKSQFILQ